MGVQNSGDVIRRLETLLNAGATGTLSDGQLLERFTTDRGEPRERAFAALVERHGPLVLRVCRAVLRDEDAAEDAFQATFLALARKAGSLWANDSLAPWLHQAAYRAAIHDRSATIRRRSRERAAAALRADVATPPRADAELETIIHEEIDRLPDRFRVAVVLCDLEGRTHEQVARHLGCAVGTVKSRLARGRQRLRGRLTRRGVEPSSSLVVASTGGVSRAALPTTLARSTVASAATAGAASASIDVISRGVVKAMFMSKIKLASTVVAFAAGAVLLAWSGVGRSTTGALSDRPAEVAQEQPRIVLSTPRVMDVDVADQYVAQIHAHRQIYIGALNDGYLSEIHVKEGQAAKKGDLLFGIVSSLDKTKPNIESHDIEAPFDGLVGTIPRPLDDKLKEGDQLTTLSDNSVMWVYFNLPEARYLEFLADPKRQETARIELVLANNAKFPEAGKIGAIDSRFNNQTGNIAFRADFPNPNGLLRHGQTGTIRLHRTLRDALVIPQRATHEINDKRYVYVVGKDDVAHRREIVVQNELDDVFVVAKGIAAGDRVVIDGVQRVRDGEKVEYDFQPPEKATPARRDRDGQP